MKLLLEDGGALLLEDGGFILCNYQIKPLFQWHCREFSDRTAKIRCALDPVDDFIKGDGATPSTYPTFVSTDTDTGTPSHYVFDGVDDYIGNWPTMPTVYTVCAVVDTGTYPELWTCNDTTIQTALTTSGSWSGSLYRLAIFDAVLDADQLEILEYNWVSKVPRSGCRGIEHRLILDGSCVLNHRYTNGDSNDITDNGHDGVDTDVTYSSGAVCALTTSKITVTDAVDLRISEMTFAFACSVSDKRYVANKGDDNYKISIDGSTNVLKVEDANGDYRSVTIPWDSSEHHYIVILKNGDPVNAWMDGIYIGASTENAVIGAIAANLIIGETVSPNATATIKMLQLYNRILNAHEIKSLYHRYKIG